MSQCTPIAAANPDTIAIVAHGLDLTTLTPSDLDECILAINAINLVQRNLELLLAGEWHPRRGSRGEDQPPLDVDLKLAGRMEESLYKHLAHWERMQQKLKACAEPEYDEPDAPGKGKERIYYINRFLYINPNQTPGDMEQGAIMFTSSSSRAVPCWPPPSSPS